MKSFIAIALFISLTMSLKAQPAPAPNEFSNPTIQVGVVVSDLEKSSQCIQPFFV